MANSTFPIPVGVLNGGNGAIARAIAKRRLSWIWDGGRFWWYQRIRIVGGAIGATALAGAANQTFDLHTAFPANLFPSNVIRLDCTYQKLATAFAGGAVSACTGEIGDAGDTDGLLTATNIFTGASTARANTVGAAENASRNEEAFVPTYRIVATTANVNALTAGALTIYIPFLPAASA